MAWRNFRVLLGGGGMSFRVLCPLFPPWFFIMSFACSFLFQCEIGGVVPGIFQSGEGHHGERGRRRGEELLEGCPYECKRTGIHDVMSVRRPIWAFCFLLVVKRVPYDVGCLWADIVSHRKRAASHVSDSIPSCNVSRRRGMYILRDM